MPTNPFLSNTYTYTWTAGITQSSFMGSFPEAQPTSPPTPSSEDDMVISCGICGSESYDYSTPTYYNSNGIKTRMGLCSGCAESADYNYIFCPHPDHMDIIEVDDDWRDYYGTLGVCPCPEHSLEPHAPKVACSICDTETGSFYYTGRLQPLCYSCNHNSVLCAASYCRVPVHPSLPESVTSTQGTRVYCGPCSVVKTLPAGIPNTTHPYTWDYKPGCGCTMCSYLQGKDPKWPPPEIPVEPDTTCVGCATPISTIHATIVEGGSVDGLYCHICSMGMKKCRKCGKGRPASMFHNGQWYGSPLPPGTCDVCVEQSDGFWFCDVQCNAWIQKVNTDCDCGGVHPYNYSPESFRFLMSRKDSNLPPDDIPFMGLEIEIEAQKPGTSRRAGAILTRSIMGDIGWCMHDGSLLGTKSNGTGGQMGFEFVTHPFTYEWLSENWHLFVRLFTTLSAEGYRSWEGGRCGMHIHISRGPMSDAHQMKFIRMVLGSSNLMTCVGQRGYRDKNLSRFSPFHADDRARLIEKVRSFRNPNVDGHYTALNTNRSSTIEARWFRGTLNPESARKNIELIHSMWWFTKQYGFSSANEINYIDWLRQPQYANKYRTLLHFLERNYITRR